MWEARRYKEREVPMDDDFVKEHRSELRDHRADIQLRCAEQRASGEYEEFAETLPPHYRRIADALREDPDITGKELAGKLGLSQNYVWHARGYLRRHWTQFWRHRELQLQHDSDMRAEAQHA